MIDHGPLPVLCFVSLLTTTVVIKLLRSREHMATVGRHVLHVFVARIYLFCTPIHILHFCRNGVPGVYDLWYCFNYTGTKKKVCQVDFSPVRRQVK